MIWLACVLATVALTSVVPLRPDGPPAALLGFWWLSSFMGQAFALPWALVCVILALADPQPPRWVFAAAALVFGYAHLRNCRAGRRMLDAVGLREFRLPLHAGLAPFITGGRHTRRIRNLAYGEAGTEHLLDLVVAKAPVPGAMPILIHVHGGGWVIGKKDQQGKPLIDYLARRGWLCVDLNYRLGPAHRGPAWVEDVLRAIAWVRAHAAEYGGDPARIAITGGSAGGHLAALAALAHDDPAFKPGFEQADCSVAAMVPCYGRYDLLDRQRQFGRNHEAVVDKYMAVKVMPGLPTACPDLWHAVSPIDRVRKDAPPALILHGTGDVLLPYQDARDFTAALAGASANGVTYVELPGIQHGWDMANSAVTWAQARAIEAFLAPLRTSG